MAIFSRGRTMPPLVSFFLGGGGGLPPLPPPIPTPILTISTRVQNFYVWLYIVSSKIIALFLARWLPFKPLSKFNGSYHCCSILKELLHVSLYLNL